MTFQQLRHVSANVRIFCGKKIKGRSFEMFIVSSGNWVEKLQKAETNSVRVQSLNCNQ